MIDNEVSEKYANEIIDEIDRNCKADVTMDYMLSEIYQRMILKFGKPYMVEENNDGLRVVFLWGRQALAKRLPLRKLHLIFILSTKEGSTLNSGYIPDCGGGAVAHIRQYFGSTISGSVYSRGDYQCGGGL